MLLHFLPFFEADIPLLFSSGPASACRRGGHQTNGFWPVSPPRPRLPSYHRSLMAGSFLRPSGRCRRFAGLAGRDGAALQPPGRKGREIPAAARLHARACGARRGSLPVVGPAVVLPLTRRGRGTPAPTRTPGEVLGAGDKRSCCCCCGCHPALPPR